MLQLLPKVDYLLEHCVKAFMCSFTVVSLLHILYILFRARLCQVSFITGNSLCKSWFKPAHWLTGAKNFISIALRDFSLRHVPLPSSTKIHRMQLRYNSNLHVNSVKRGPTHISLGWVKSDISVVDSEACV